MNELVHKGILSYAILLSSFFLQVQLSYQKPVEEKSGMKDHRTTNSYMQKSCLQHNSHHTPGDVNYMGHSPEIKSSHAGNMDPFVFLPLSSCKTVDGLTHWLSPWKGVFPFAKQFAQGVHISLCMCRSIKASDVF